MSDHLSARLTTDTNGNVLGQQGHYPYGESWYAASATTKWQFTSYERDAESGNDYAIARYHVNRLGRFSAPDPIAGSLADPQSLNRYAYVRNSPISLVDPTGLCLAALFDENGNVSACYDSMLFSRGGGDPWAPSLAEEEARYLGYLQAAFLKTILSKLFKENQECADLLGGTENARFLLSKMNSINVPLTPVTFPSKVHAATWGLVASGAKAAGTVWGRRSRRPDGWDQRPFITYVGQEFVAYTSSMQETLLIHEMAHVYTNSNTGPDQPGSPYSNENIAKVCDTAIPVRQQP